MEPDESPMLSDRASHRVQIAHRILADQIRITPYEGDMPHSAFMAGMCTQSLRWADMLLCVNDDMERSNVFGKI